MAGQQGRGTIVGRAALGLVALAIGLSTALLEPVAVASPLGEADDAITAAWKAAGGDTSDLGAKQGLDRANWTHEELADHLHKTKGLSTSRSAGQRFCSKIGIRLYRPTYRYLRGNPQKQAQAKEDLADLGKGRRPVNSSC